MARYCAFGDSMSIDLYPELDARERYGTVETGIGAASLLYRNVDALWPEFAGKDLSTRFPGIELEHRTSDGALLSTVADEQLAGLTAPDEITIATLTVGGNDLLSALALAFGGIEALMKETARIQHQFMQLVRQLRSAMPNALLVLTTVYDPTDGTGMMFPDGDRLPIELLKQMNVRIRAIARETPGTVLADAHLHFMGHGVHAPADEQWYWKPSPIEPSARGASEIRRLFWNAINA